MVCVSAMTEDMISPLNQKRVERGANVMFLGPYGEGVFYGTQVINDVRIASPLQIYLDPKGHKGRGGAARGEASGVSISFLSVGFAAGREEFLKG
jgi:hypothetical protein